MKFLRTAFLLLLALACLNVAAQEPKAIHAYAIGNWRNGPVVYITPLFGTTEAFTTPQLIARVRKEYPEFKDLTEIDIQRFATAEEGEQSRRELKGKFGMRNLEVRLLETEPAEP